MALTQQYTLMLDTPIEFTSRGGIRTTVVGTPELFQQVVDELPDRVRFGIQQVGQYQPDRTDTLFRLTNQQLEVFETAIELGYYGLPRRAPHEEIAKRLECAPSANDEHPRKAESRALASLVRGGS
jgi:predicted DNA binding protein